MKKLLLILFICTASIAYSQNSMRVENNTDCEIRFTFYSYSSSCFQFRPLVITLSPQTSQTVYTNGQILDAEISQMDGLACWSTNASVPYDSSCIICSSYNQYPSSGAIPTCGNCSDVDIEYTWHSCDKKNLLTVDMV